MNAQLEHDESAPAMTTLVSGIVSDAQTLIRQQLSLFQVELKNDLQRTKEAAVPLVVGGAVAFLAGVILAIAAAHGLYQRWPELTLAGGFGIVGLVLGVAGGGLVLWGKSRFSANRPIADKSVEGLKENLQWKTKMSS